MSTPGCIRVPGAELAPLEAMTLTASASPASPPAAEGLTRWRSIFAADVRSLAALRIALAILVLLDIRLRWPVAESLYSDAGFLPRSLAEEYYRLFSGVGGRPFWSLLWLDGSVWLARALFLVEGIAAVLFLAGWQTRLANLVLWVAIVSIHVRNPLVTTSADMLLKLMLLWSLFLPLARVWSLDSRRRPAAPDPRPVVSFATAGFILQFVLMYFFTGVAKWNREWLDGTAMEYVLRLDIYTTPFGWAMLDWPLLLRLIAWGTLLIELVVIWLIFVPWRNAWWRMAVMLVFWGFHLGIALSMTIGLFPWICMAAWLILIPGAVWDRIGLRVPASGLAAHGSPAERLPCGWQAGTGVAGNVFCGLLILLTVAWNIAQLDYPRYARLFPSIVGQAGRLLAIDQYFQMFGKLHRENSWWVYRARLADGREVDIFRGGRPVVWDKPPRVADTFPDHNWRKLHDNLTQSRYQPFRQPLLDAAVNSWNRTHSGDGRVVFAELHRLSCPIGPGVNTVDRRSEIWGTWGDDPSAPGSRFDDLFQRMQSGEGPAF